MRVVVLIRFKFTALPTRDQPQNWRNLIHLFYGSRDGHHTALAIRQTEIQSWASYSDMIGH